MTDVEMAVAIVKELRRGQELTKADLRKRVGVRRPTKQVERVIRRLKRNGFVTSWGTRRLFIDEYGANPNLNRVKAVFRA